VPLPDPGNPAETGLPPSLSDAIASPGPDKPAALPHAPANSNASPDQLAAACADLRPGIPLLAMAYPEFAISGPGPGRNGPTWARAAPCPQPTEARSMPQTTGTPVPPPSEPAPACYRNPGSPADQALTTIVSMLAADGYSFSIPSWDGDAYLRIDNAVQALADLTITGHGEVTWEYRTFQYPHTSPDRLIGTAVELLDPDHTGPVPAVPPDYRNAPLLGAILHALSGHGLTVTVTETGADTQFVLTVTNPGQPYRGSIRITGDGELQWNTRAPHHPDGGIPLPGIAATITRALARAHHPATSMHEQASITRTRHKRGTSQARPSNPEEPA
jgi:hypothetical protein